MTAVAEKVLREALELPPVDRAGLIERLFRSFDSSGNGPVDSAWATEVEARIDAYNRGEIDASPAEDVLARMNRL
uniref:Putative addiction module component, TIGR02574 family n=1 Tax=Candidatus Kentrum eta TaxID=2126337 RepID=A0A450VHY4_9GAMM|nr:MAG: putative addiction module component, TIGR02574 family [Candidatus Kentron sp. H]VFJ88705.1 MAG: putative addiction module component, TIGR02574 family [Candidatus Kentron sp. H]VFJ94977.1 MAG: putative addiction module component, TIGR02574 family [Candidatus Kentron sp. H]VFJ96836.1 MAG: putative addiction module component, TIGR02574 family [Candidatus Kentron sp. H]VFJ97444.1 MAG: putative addiction module component, TIGR02574 family [Candidatus Kentron sp. H]